MTMTKTNTLHEQQVLEIIEQVQIVDQQTYLVGGQLKRVYHQQHFTNYNQPLVNFGSNVIEEGSQEQKQRLIQHLCNTLYTKFYCGNEHALTSFKMPSKKERSAFMDILSSSNHSTQKPDPNWKVYSIHPNGLAFAEKNNQLRTVHPNTYVPNPSQSKLAVNQFIQFYRQKENRHAQAVFYYVYGNEYLAPDCNMIRIYWNTTPAGAPLLLEQITTVLNEYRIPFNFKCLNHPTLYNRSDSAVLYFDKNNIAIVKILLEGIIKKIKPHLKSTTPYFTDIIHPGVSLAEDPGNGQSFGMSRCLLIAEAIHTAFQQKIAKEDLFPFAKKYLKAKGVNSQQMSLNPHTQHFLLRQ